MRTLKTTTFYRVVDSDGHVHVETEVYFHANMVHQGLITIGDSANIEKIDEATMLTRTVSVVK